MEDPRPAREAAHRLPPAPKSALTTCLIAIPGRPWSFSLTYTRGLTPSRVATPAGPGNHASSGNSGVTRGLRGGDPGEHARRRARLHDSPVLEDSISMQQGHSRAQPPITPREQAIADARQIDPVERGYRGARGWPGSRRR
jgi:hypothetical protein